MFEFLTATGIAGFIAISLIFIAVFVLAAPGKEISFWGVRFEKRYSNVNFRKYRRLPKNLPEDWKIVIKAFAAEDKHHLHQSKVFDYTVVTSDFTELKTREVCADMEKYGLIKWLGNYIYLENRALPLIKTIEL